MIILESRNRFLITEWRVKYSILDFDDNHDEKFEFTTTKYLGCGQRSPRCTKLESVSMWTVKERLIGVLDMYKMRKKWLVILAIVYLCNFSWKELELFFYSGNLQFIPIISKRSWTMQSLISFLTKRRIQSCSSKPCSTGPAVGILNGKRR